ncbi:MAG TPA: nuclear transport factor 2 family protein [Acidimicrobiia bacterium]|jgi:ketosteroid isomerase-like protein
MSGSASEASGAEAVLRRYLQAQADKDLDALVSCWAPDVEVEHPLRPDRSWRGIDTYRRQWARIWEGNPGHAFELVSAAVDGNRIYLEARVEHADGTMVPNMNVLEVEDGRIRRGRVYTDTPVRDGVDMDRFVLDLNRGAPDVVDRFFAALHARDLDAVAACVHPEFEMVAPQRPARGFTGGAQEVANMRYLLDTYPDLEIRVLRKAHTGDEVWTETTATATGLELAAVIVWEVDTASDTLRRGRFYSEPVEHDAPGIDQFLRGLGDDSGP